MVAKIFKNKILLSNLILFVCAFASPSVYAKSWWNSNLLQDILENLSKNYPAIRLAISAFAFTVGLMLVVKSVHKLRAYGQVRTMMPSHAELMSPMLQLALGIALVFLPTLIRVSITSFWGYSNPLARDAVTGSTFGPIETSIGGLLQILGLIAVVRGVTILARSAQKGAQPGMFGKGLTHFIGGICAVNFWGVLATLRASIGQ